MPSDKRFAVLIDADNVSEKYIKFILNELAGEGVITYKRIYGDWTRPELGTWKGVLLSHSITPIQQYGYTTGKNATDSAMIIDAMDILYAGNVEGFCIVSSDSDFTRLASRLRESGKYVIGMGEKKTPNAFVAACNRFTYLEVLMQPLVPHSEKSAAVTVPEGMSLEEIRRAIRVIVEETSDDDGWATVSDIGNILIKRYPDFDVRAYGFQKLTRFISSLAEYDIKPVPSRDGGGKSIFVRGREAVADTATAKPTEAEAAEGQPLAPAKKNITGNKPRGKSGKAKPHINQ